MRNFHMDTGCVFDTLAFLTTYFKYEKNKQSENGYSHNVLDRLREKETMIPHYLYPFVARGSGKLSFLDLLLFNGTTCYICDKKKAFQIMDNSSLVFGKYIEHYFHGLSAWSVRQRIRKHPDGFEMMRKQCIESTLEMYVYYSILHQEEILESLSLAFGSVYDEVEIEQNKYIAGLPDSEKTLNSYTESRLRAISGISDGECLRYSFTLMEPHRVSYSSLDPAFFLLGSAYKNVLEAEYKYIGITPYDFARAVGNPAKNAIYRALLQKSPLTRAEMEKSLHLSRAALDRNLAEMRDTGLVVMSERRGDAYFYRLDHEFIRIAAEKMLADAGGQNR